MKKLRGGEKKSQMDTKNNYRIKKLKSGVRGTVLARILSEKNHGRNK